MDKTCTVSQIYNPSGKLVDIFKKLFFFSIFQPEACDVTLAPYVKQPKLFLAGGGVGVLI